MWTILDGARLKYGCFKVLCRYFSNCVVSSCVISPLFRGVILMPCVFYPYNQGLRRGGGVILGGGRGKCDINLHQGGYVLPSVYFYVSFYAC